MSITAGDIMTEELTVFSHKDRVGSSRETMEKRGFDVAPVEISGYVRKYVHIDDLQEVSSTDRIIEHADTIEEHQLLGSDIPVVKIAPGSRDLVTILDERDMDFAFIVNDGIEGIITHADFNKVRAGTPLYRLISEYEEAVCDLIDQEVKHDRWLSLFDSEERGELETMYEEQKEENAELRMEECLNTRFLNKIILEYELWPELGFDDEDRAEEVLSEIKSFRDDVMHQRPVVGEHSFVEFVEIINDLKEVNQSLSE